MSAKIKVIIKRPDEAGHVTNISNTLENLQRTVGGPIECVTIAEDLVIICNEEGKLRGLPYNFTCCGDRFVGTIIMAGRCEDEFTDIPPELTLKFFRERIVGA